ncbi:MAG TPA: hypothetical protein VFQ41_00920 [Candidatus Angelobacter sp.]|nr:hypothetical protein [Candidatus Angelobacter sp.]
MKNCVIIAIFLAVAVISASAQKTTNQAPAPDSAKTVSIASETKPLQAHSVTLAITDPQPRPDLKELTEDLTEYQRGQIEGRNQQLKAHFAAQQQAGGWQRVFLKQLALQRLEVPNATLQLNAAQRFITNYVFCERPLIADQTSDFQTFANSAHMGTRTRSADLALEPRSSIIINGCSFGPDAGEVRLILNRDAGSFLALQVNDWSDISILATLGTAPEIPDQEAQLVVVRKDGTQSIPMTIEFFQHRVAKVFHVPGRLDDLRLAAGRP